MRHIPRSTAAVLAALLPLAAPAQNPDGPYWSSYLLPAQTQSIQVLGQLAVLRTATEVHLYSGQLRSWTVQPAGVNATLQVTNKYALIQEGQQIHSWCTATGRIETLAVSAAATLNVGSLSSSWTACVVDAGKVYGWSGFLGRWVSFALQGQLEHLSLGSHTILAVDGGGAHAFSAFYGGWVAGPARTGGVYRATRSGCIALLPGPDEVAAFSAYQNGWTRAAMPGALGAAITDLDGATLVVQGGELALVSTLTGNIARRSDAFPPALYTARNLVLIDDGTLLTGYAPATDALVFLAPSRTIAAIHLSTGNLGSCAVLVDIAGSHLAFSGLTGRAAKGPMGAGTVTMGDTAAFAEVQGGQAYSALLDRWVPAPAGQILGVAANFECVFLTTPTGFEAFSARTGTWAPLASASGLVVQTAGALAAAVGASGVDAFDPILGKWTHQAVGAMPSWSVWRQTGIAHDGAKAYGYSLFHQTWESIDLPGGVVSFKANDSIGCVETPTHVHIFAGIGSLTNQSRFAEFSRFAVRGGELMCFQAGPAGALVVGLIGTRRTEMSLPSLGLLRVDPAGMVPVLLGTIPAGGMLTARLRIPGDPLLNGLALHVQDLVIPSPGQPWLTNAMSPIVW